ncbi:MAG: ATP-binding cassette domain-containing protein, partial [Deinococcus-Thermus bacterium]|nr:ATP-binding cassette domain-containing protein [Deinococcota bacterium]
MDAYLELVALEKRYDATAAVSGFDDRIAKGEFVSLLGPSGCGKTTTLRMIAGFVEPTSGRILLRGQPIDGLPPHRRNIGIVFQNYALFPHLTAAQNVGFGLRMRGLAKAEQAERVDAALRLVGLAGFERRYPAALSGGQQQRVALARALVIEPDVLLLDEPLSNLDAALRGEMRDEIRSLQRRLGITTVFVTHDQQEALAMSDRIIVMAAGRIVEDAAPRALSEHPRSLFAAGFLGARSVLPGRARRDGDSLVFDLAGGLACPMAESDPIDATHLVLRSARLGLADAGAGATATAGLSLPGEVAGVV